MCQIIICNSIDHDVLDCHHHSLSAHLRRIVHAHASRAVYIFYSILIIYTSTSIILCASTDKEFYCTTIYT